MNPEVAKAMAEFFAGMMENESKTTAKVLAAVPDTGRDYRPDPKSRSAWELATHLAASEIWFLDGVLAGAFKYDPEAEKKTVGSFGTVQDVVTFYEREVPPRIQQVRRLSPEKLATAIDFFGAMQEPTVTYLGLANNHAIHHRGQLAAYLRAMGSKVPSIYGGSADEPMSGQ